MRRHWYIYIVGALLYAAAVALGNVVLFVIGTVVIIAAMVVSEVDRKAARKGQAPASPDGSVHAIRLNVHVRGTLLLARPGATCTFRGGGCLSGPGAHRHRGQAVTSDRWRTAPAQTPTPEETT